MSADSPRLLLLGSSHRVASLEDRERISLPADAVEPFLQNLAELPGLEEHLLLNTCNRTEIYAVARQSLGGDDLLGHLARFRSIDPDFLRQRSYLREGEAVIRHLFEVAAGLDSQMVGETEILGQVKEAYEDAGKRGSAGKFLHRLFQKSFQAAKWARTHTGVSRGQVSLGNVICELSRRIFGNVADCRLLVVGSGEVAELALDAFKSRGTRAITVTGRTYEKARELAEGASGSVLAFDDFRDSLHLFDVVLCSTAGDERILAETDARAAIARRPARPLFLIDVAMPRDVEQAAGDLENVYLYNLDDVSAIANENLKSRQAEVSRCRQALAARAEKLRRNLQG